MKKLLALTLAVMMLFTLVACATEEPAESSAPAASSTPATESSTAPESSEEAPESSEEPAPESSEEEPTPESSEEESSEEPEPEEPVENPYEELEIGKATTAPVVDGKVEDGEYATVIEYDELDFHWANGAIGDVDAVLLVVESGNRVGEVEKSIMKKVDEDVPLILVINKKCLILTDI